jgi:hypothetical protein
VRLKERPRKSDALRSAGAKPSKSARQKGCASSSGRRSSSKQRSGGAFSKCHRVPALLKYAGPIIERSSSATLTGSRGLPPSSSTWPRSTHRCLTLRMTRRPAHVAAQKCGKICKDAAARWPRLPKMPARKGSTRVYVFCAGGAEGGRTPDLLIANEALSQLSYGPALSCGARQVESAARARICI